MEIEEKTEKSEAQFVKPGPNKRVCAFLFDLLVFSYFLEILKIVHVLPVRENFGWAIVCVYLLLRDCGGQSFGKYFVGMRVLDAQGGHPAIGSAIKRNLTVIIPLFPLIEYFVMIADKVEGKRLGDTFAKTKVTDLKPQIPDWLFLFGSLFLVVVNAAL